MTATKKAAKAPKAKAAPVVMTPAERQARRRERMANEGARLVQVHVTAAAGRALDKLTASGLSATDAINAALIAATTRKR